VDTEDDLDEAAKLGLGTRTSLVAAGTGKFTHPFGLGCTIRP
jgi:hypothetical protein